MKNGCPVSSACFGLLLWILPLGSSAFAPSDAGWRRSSSSSSSSSSSTAKGTRFKLWLEAFIDEDDTGVPLPQKVVASEVWTPQELFPTAEFLDLNIKEHRPLGCTIEESLAIHPVTHVVFVSKVVSGGFAETAGLLVGDVLVGVTGIFGDLESVTGLGVDKVKALVSSVPDTEPLIMIVARDTQVLAQHEDALVELCASPGTSDKQIEECVVQYITEGYNYQPDEIDVDIDDNNDNEIGCDDADTECMLDGMHLMWADDLPASSSQATATATATLGSTEQESAPQVKPWSNRSSGSGTYVRDPKTGEMRNIDQDP